jgi:hypothetical protein
VTASLLVYIRESRDLWYVSLWAGGVQDAEIRTCFCAFYGDCCFIGLGRNIEERPDECD